MSASPSSWAPRPAAPAAPNPAPVPGRILPSLAALQAFERAAAKLSFRGAAYQLALSPSAISHQIRNLEDHFGVRLFLRDGRKIQLTPEGESYLSSVTRAIALLEDASKGLMHQGRSGRRELRVSALPFFMSTVMIPRMAAFETRWPDLSLRVDTSYDHADFNRTDLDVAIRYGRGQVSGLRLVPLIKVYSLPVCSPTVAADLELRRDLADQVLIHVTHKPRAWGCWLQDAGLEDRAPRGELWVDSLPAALDAAEHGLGIALAPDPLINGRRGFGHALAPVGPRGLRHSALTLVCRAEHYDARWMTAFRRWLTDAVRLASEPSIATPLDRSGSSRVRDHRSFEDLIKRESHG